jgi:hypothetical protein
VAEHNLIDVRKRRLPKFPELDGVLLAIMSGWGPWVARCSCGEISRGAPSRKRAKDYHHMHLTYKQMQT